jgi:hypothetical protein
VWAFQYARTWAMALLDVEVTRLLLRTCIELYEAISCQAAASIGQSQLGERPHIPPWRLARWNHEVTDSQEVQVPETEGPNGIVR